jgi:hypothetical protein
VRLFWIMLCCVMICKVLLNVIECCFIISRVKFCSVLLSEFGDKRGEYNI